MAILNVERFGGLAGFGGEHSRIRSHGKLDMSTLTAEDQETVTLLFQATGKTKPKTKPDGFRYRISRKTSTGIDTIEVAESEVPAILTQCVKDELI